MSAKVLDEGVERFFKAVGSANLRHLVLHVLHNPGILQHEAHADTGITVSTVHYSLNRAERVHLLKSRHVPRPNGLRAIRLMWATGQAREWAWASYGPSAMVDGRTPICTGFGVCPLCGDWSTWLRAEVGVSPLEWSEVDRPGAKALAKQIEAAWEDGRLERRGGMGRFRQVHPTDGYPIMQAQFLRSKEGIGLWVPPDKREGDDVYTRFGPPRTRGPQAGPQAS